MALKILIKKHKLDTLREALQALNAKDAEFEQRENELTQDIDAATTDEEQAAVDAAVEQYEADKTAHEFEKDQLKSKITELEAEIAADESEQTPPEPENGRAANNVKKERTITMNYEQRFADMNVEQRTAFVERDDVKTFLTRVRELGKESRAISGADLLIPDVLLGMVRTEVARSSKLLRFVNQRSVPGTSKVNIMGDIPEAVWTETCASLNELAFGFNQVTADGHKVGGYIAICNAILKDSDINLTSEIISVLSTSIAKALDKAILYGVGNSKMPLGIVSRLAQTAQPDTWGAKAPTWTDLHTSNIQKINKTSASGVEFFSALIEKLAIAKPKYSSDGLFWVMNRKTHLDILIKALNFNAAGALVAGANTFPIIGGTIVEFEDDEIADNEIIGGYGGNYLLVQREGVALASSEHVFFLDDQTVFKATARYDGMPLTGEAFVVVNYANTDATTAADFPNDYANTGMNILTVTAAVGSTNGNTVLTVTDTVAESNAVLKYKVKATTDGIKVGDTPKGTWTALTSGTTQITAAAGVQIAVIELDDAGRVVSTGSVISVPKS